MKLQGKTLLLTGASSGIGRELARELSLAGAQLILSGRDKEALAATASSLHGSSSIICCDLAEQGAAERLAQEALAIHGRIDGLWNNAGIAPCGPAEAASATEIDRLFRVNCSAPLTLSAALLPQLKRQKESLLAFTGSVFGYIGFPYYSIYSASKFALRGYCQSLRRELHGQGLQVFYAAPRAVATKINADKAAMAQATGMKMDAPALVAQKLVQAVLKNRERCIIGPQEAFFSRLNGLFPGVVDAALQGEQQKMQPFMTRHAEGP